MYILLKLNYATLGVSSLFCQKNLGRGGGIGSTPFLEGRAKELLEVLFFSLYLLKIICIVRIRILEYN